MKDTKMVAMFDAIPRQQPISKYSKELKKMLQKQTLGDLVYTLKNPRHFKKQIFLEEFNLKHPKNPSQYSEAKLNEALKRKSNPINNTFSSSPMRTKIKEIAKTNVDKMKYLNSLKETPDPFRYNPNFNAIYKKSPAATLSSSLSSNRDGDQRQSTLPVLNEVKDNLALKKSLEENSALKKNHALKFSQYTFRKGIVNERDYNSEPNEVVVVNWKDKSEIKAPDFGKMSVRGEYCMVNKSSLGIPTSCHYHPNYAVIRKHSPEIKFNQQKPVLRINKDYYVKYKN